MSDSAELREVFDLQYNAYLGQMKSLYRSVEKITKQTGRHPITHKVRSSSNADLCTLNHRCNIRNCK